MTAPMADESQRAGGHGSDRGGPERRLRPMREALAELLPEFPDLTHSSLRFLEREGLISPSRSPGGHRLLSDDDVARIRQIKRWQAQRLSIEEIRARLIELDRLPPAREIADRFLGRAIAGDRAGAFQAVLAADDAGMPLIDVFGEILQPALIELGVRWERGDLLVAQEKEVSELTRDLVAELVRRHAVPNPKGPVVVAACIEEELHELGLRMVSGLLRAQGYTVHYLGADVPPWYLLDATLLRRPDAILLSGKVSPRLPAVKESIDRVKARLPAAATPIVIVGGEIAIKHAEMLRSWGAIPVSDDRLGPAFRTTMAAVPPVSSRQTG